MKHSLQCLFYFQYFSNASSNSFETSEYDSSNVKKNVQTDFGSYDIYEKLVEGKKNKRNMLKSRCTCNQKRGSVLTAL